MTEIEKKALALLNEVERDHGYSDLTSRIMRGLIWDEALCRSIEQHESYKQRVSDALEYYRDREALAHDLRVFIIPKPTVDPLVEALNAMPNVCEDEFDADDAAKLREALAKRGLKIVEDV